MTFPFPFPLTFGQSQFGKGLPLTGWFAELYGTAAATITPTAAASGHEISHALATITPAASTAGYGVGAAAVTVTPTAAASGSLVFQGVAAATVTPTETVSATAVGTGSAAITPAAATVGYGVGAAAVTVTPTPSAAGQPVGAASATVTPAAAAAGYGLGSAAVTVTPAPSTTGFIDPTFDAVGAGYTGQGSPSWSHTITGNAIVVFASIDVNSSTPTVSATCGGTAMTQLGALTYSNGGGFYSWIYAFGLLTPPTGAKTIAISCSGTHPIAANSLSYNNVTGFGTAATSFSSSVTAPSMTASSATGQMVAQAFAGNTTTFSAYNQTQRYNKAWASSVNLSFVMGDAAGASSVTFSATGSQQWGGIAIPIQ